MKKNNSKGLLLFFFKTALVLVSINVFSVLIPTNHLEGNIKKAYALSRLTQSDVGGNTYGYDSWRGNHQYQDCLVLMQALHLSDDWKENAFLGPKSGEAKCDWLYNYVFKLKDRNELMSSVTNYPQYNHGVVAVTSILGSVFRLETLRAILKLVSILLIGFIGLSLFNIGIKYDKLKGLKYGAVGTVLTLLTLHGIDFFGQNLSHGLGDWVSLGFLGTLLWAVYKNYSFKTNMLICILFGSLSAYIEYLIGVLPFSIISILIFLGIKMLVDSKYKLKKGVKLLSAYGLSFVGTFLVFLIVKSIFIDSMFTNFLNTFLFRVNGELDGVSFTIGETFVRLYDYLDYLGSGNKQIVIISFGLILVLVIYSIISNFKFLKENKIPSLLFFVAFICPVFWYIFFLNHTYIHCWFMLRFTTVSLMALILLASIMAKTKPMPISKTSFLAKFFKFVNEKSTYIVVVLCVLVVMVIVLKDYSSKEENIEAVQVAVKRPANNSYLELLNKAAVYKDSICEIYIEELEGANRIIYLKRDTISEKEIESKYFLHVYPANKTLLKNGDNFLGLDFKNNVIEIEKDNQKYFFSDAILPNIKISAINTGLYGYKGNNSIYWQIENLLKPDSFNKETDVQLKQK